MSTVAIQGDNHGNIDTLESNIVMFGLSGMTIFHVGDFGYNLSHFRQNEQEFKKSLVCLNKFLKTRSIVMNVIRGNHDNPAYFDGRFILSNIKLLPDYTVVNHQDKNWLMVGGAISVDRGGRTEGISFWKNEGFNLDWSKYKDLRNIDYVITHTAPTVALDPDVLHSDVVKRYALSYDDDLLERDTRIERSQLQSLYETLQENNKITNWYYGHFHIHMHNEFNDTKFRCVEIDALIEHR